MFYSRVVSCYAVLQRYLVLSAVKETRPTPTKIMHLVGERSLSLHLSPEQMRSYNRI